MTTFNKFTSVATANVQVTINPMVFTPNPAWDPVGAPLFPSPGSTPPFKDPVGTGGVLVWDNWASGIGATYSGPTGNGANDIIFLVNNSVGALGGATSMLVDPTTGQISEADILFDTASFLAGGVTPAPNSFAPLLPPDTTAFMHEIGHWFGLDHTNLHGGVLSLGGVGGTVNPIPSGGAPPSLNSAFTPPATGLIMAEFPGMVGGVIGSNGSNHVNFVPINNDESTAISVLYPVTTIGGGKWPLINWSARVEGRLLASSGVGAYGMNALAYAHVTGPTLTPGLPEAATVTGFLRLNLADVVGLADTGTGAPCSGAFVIEGLVTTVPPGLVPLGSGLRKDLVWEAQECSSPGVGYGEWVSETYMNPVGINTWPISTVQTAIVCNDAGPVGSLEMAAGTIIELGSIRQTGTTFVDFASRPLVEIAPRMYRPTGNQVITIQVTHANPLNLGTATLTINGLPPLTAPTGPIVISPTRTQWTLPAAALAAGSQRVRFRISESSAPPGRRLAFGINEVIY